MSVGSRANGSDATMAATTPELVEGRTASSRVSGALRTPDNSARPWLYPDPTIEHHPENRSIPPSAAAK